MNAGVPAASPWSPRQRAWLQALGHVVYRHGAVDGEPSPHDRPLAGDDGAQRAAPASGPASAPASDRPATPRRAAPAHPAHAADAVPPGDGGEVRAPAPARGASRMPDRLQLALLRASGLDPSDPATQAAMARWPVDQLRGNPAAKRAFWPQLRALRRRP